MHSAVVRAAGIADVVPIACSEPTSRVAFSDSRAQATADERQRNDRIHCGSTGEQLCLTN